MRYQEAIEYLTRCADHNGNHWYQGHVWSDAETCPTCHGTNDAGWLRCPGSRYGWTSAHCAPIAYKVARIRTGGYDVTEEELHFAMGQVVNDSDEPQEDINQYVLGVLGLSGANIDAIVDGYLECQLWAGHDMDREDAMLDENYGREDISEEYVNKLREELLTVVTDHPLAVRMYLNARERTGYDRNELFGHDFYLTREHHGVGFWDRGLGELGDYLTNIAHAYGEAGQLWDDGNGVLIA